MIENLISEFNKLNMATTDEAVQLLQQQLAELSAQFVVQKETIAKHEASLIEHQQKIAPQEIEYQDEAAPANFEPDYSAIKNLAPFSGNREQYAAWRKQATTTMKMYESHKQSGKYFTALNILMNGKITGNALDELTSHNTPLNFTAIIKRLDHAYAEKRTLELLRQQMQFLNQGQKKPMEFYDAIEKHLNLIIGKIQIEYEGKPDVIGTWIEDSRRDALKTLLRGLQPAISSKLQMKYPSNLLDAYGKLQEVEFEYEHQKMFNVYNAPMPRKTAMHPNLQSTENAKGNRPTMQNTQQASFVRPNSQQYVATKTFNEQLQSPFERVSQNRNNFGFQQKYTDPQRLTYTRPPQRYNDYNNSPNEDVSMKVVPEKRPNSSQQNFANKHQRINNIDIAVNEEEPHDEPEQYWEPADEHDQIDNEKEEDAISFLE